ncbi:MAG: hypothetical protein V7731_01300 [Amphritea sp.]
MKVLTLIFALLIPSIGVSAEFNSESPGGLYKGDFEYDDSNGYGSSVPNNTDIVIAEKDRSSRNSVSDFGGVLYQPSSYYKAEEMTVIGMNRDTALSMSGTFIEGQVENDDPCSNRHNVGDVSNRWCHAYFSQLAHSVLKENGYNEYVAHAGGLLVFMLKELGDVNYDWSDINTAANWRTD